MATKGHMAARHGLFRRVKFVLACCFTLSVLAGVVTSMAVHAADLEFPPLTGRVVDSADLLGAGLESELTSMLEKHERETSNQVVVVTLPSLQGTTIEDFGYRLGRHWASAGKAGTTASC